MLVGGCADAPSVQALAPAIQSLRGNLPGCTRIPRVAQQSSAQNSILGFGATRKGQPESCPAPLPTDRVGGGRLSPLPLRASERTEHATSLFPPLLHSPPA